MIHFLNKLRIFLSSAEKEPKNLNSLQYGAHIHV